LDTSFSVDFSFEAIRVLCGDGHFDDEFRCRGVFVEEVG
jgi:hypothetical protein